MSRYRRFSEDDVAEIVAEYINGISALTLAEKYGTTTSTILRYLREAGITIRSRLRTDLPVAEIVAEYVGGKSSAKLAEQYDTSALLILKHVRAAGVPVRSRGRAAGVPGKKWRQVDQNTLADVVEAYLGGATLEEAAAIAGWTTREAARLYLREAGVPTRSHSDAARIAMGKGRKGGRRVK